MKLGFIQVYNEANWIGYAIDQAMMLCDEVLIMEGAQYVRFPDISERSNDGTLDIISDREKRYPGRIKTARTTRRHRNYRINQCDNFNYGLSFCKRGDYFIILDADEYHSDRWIRKANAMMHENKVEVIEVDSNFFAFSFKWQVDFGVPGRKGIVLKIVEGLRFVQTARYINTGKRVEMIDDENNHFHYKWVKPPARMLIRMRTSGMYKGMVEWFNETWLKMKLEDGKTYEGYNGKFTLHRYDGFHPPVLKDHPWHYIEDIRRLND